VVRKGRQGNTAMKRGCRRLLICVVRERRATSGGEEDGGIPEKKKIPRVRKRNSNLKRLPSILRSKGRELFQREKGRRGVVPARWRKKKEEQVQSGRCRPLMKKEKRAVRGGEGERERVTILAGRARNPGRGACILLS